VGSDVKKQLQHLLETRAQLFVSARDDVMEEAVERKRRLCEKRGAEIVRCTIHCQVAGKHVVENKARLTYYAHYQFLIKHGNEMYVEEQIEERQAYFVDGELAKDEKISKTDGELEPPRLEREMPVDERISYEYNRAQAVRYAEIWWNSYNPAFPKFDVDCTNFVSQCLYAGGAPMTGYPNRAKGWWCKNNSWSYSWAVAHSFRWYLSGARVGLQAVEVSSPEKLMAGDVICYDFQGNGRFDHSTIVVAKDKDGMPLVNAHTTNSRMRYWSYEDSSAYTPNIRYKFFHIIDRK
jgi:Putative amidase domain